MSSWGDASARTEVPLGLLSVVPVLLIAAAVLLISQYVAPWLHNVPDNPLAGLLQSPRDRWLFAIVALVAGGVREEVQRAFLLTRFEQHLGGARVGLVVTSVAFGLGHLLQGFDAALATGTLGFIWGAMYLWRRSSVAPIVSHAGIQRAGNRALSGGGQWSLDRQTGSRCHGSSCSSFLVSLPAVTTRIYASDEIQYFAYLRSLWFDRDVSFENEYQHFYDAGIARSQDFHETFLERTTETGGASTLRPSVAGCLWAPFYAAADAGVHDCQPARRPVLATATRAPTSRRWPTPRLSMGCWRWCCPRRRSDCCRRHWPKLGPRAVMSAVLVWIGTPLLFYMYIAPPMSHATSAFAVALFVVIWLRVRDTGHSGGLIALGAATALMAMVREQDAFFAVGAAVDFLHAQATRRDGKDDQAFRPCGGRYRRRGGGLHAAGPGVHRPQRPRGAVEAGGPQDDVDRAPCGEVLASTGTWLLRLDSPCGAGTWLGCSSCCGVWRPATARSRPASSS